MILASILMGYFIGSIPTAYLTVKARSGADLRTQGSSNIGALNVYTVTKSKWTGIFVGILDAMKGILAIITAGLLFGSSFWILSITLLAAILGHIFPVWLRFHGGRGLAAAAGGMFFIGACYTIIWCVLWYLAYIFFKNILNSNIAAILVTPILLYIIPPGWLEYLMVYTTTAADYRIFSILLSIILLFGHWQVIMNMLGSKRNV